MEFGPYKFMDASQRKMARWVVATCVWLILVTILAAVYQIRNQREYFYNDAERSLGLLNVALANYTERRFSNFELLLRELRREISRLDLHNPDDRSKADTLLPDLLRQISGFTAFIVIDANGLVVATSWQPGREGVNYSDREYFLHQQQNSDHEKLLIEAPILGRRSHRWIIPLTLRLQDSKGNFNGLVYAGIDMEELLDYYSSVIPFKSGVASLFRLDAQLLARHPIVEQSFSNDYSQTELFRSYLPSKEQGVFSDISVIDKVPRLSSYHGIAGYPLILLVSLDARDLISAWHSYAWLSGIVAVCGIIVILVMTQMLLRQLHITALKSSELMQSEQLYRSLVDNLPLGFNLIDQDYRIVMSNATMCKWCAQESSSIVGGFCFQELKKQDGRCAQCPGYEVLKTGKSVVCETEIVRTDGSKFVARVHVVPIGLPGNHTGFIELIEDISDINKMREEKTSVEEQLHHAQKLEAIGAMASGIAHDFNNILVPILGYADLLMKTGAREDLKQDTLNDFLQEIIKAALRARDLIEQMLTFSREREAAYKPILVGPIVNEVVKLLRSSIPKNVEIKTEITADPMTILSDPTQIHQIVMNLCTNAYHAMKEQGGLLTVILKLASWDEVESMNIPSANQYVKLEVADTGYGMDSVTMQKIFEPYFTTNAKGGGTGLGLAVTHGLVTSMQGNIKVKSESGVGTIFQVFLPIMQHGAEKKALPTESLPTGSERILLVDDEIDVLNMLQRSLTFLGYSVTAKSSSAEALQQFENDPEKFDVVITDWAMPKMTGSQLAKEMHRITPEKPIIFCTGLLGGIGKKDKLPPGIKAIIHKPPSLSEIAKVLRDTLDRVHE